MDIMVGGNGFDSFWAQRNLIFEKLDEGGGGGGLERALYGLG
jgi:hypothetical protein